MYIIIVKEYMEIAQLQLLDMPTTFSASTESSRSEPKIAAMTLSKEQKIKKMAIGPDPAFDTLSSIFPGQQEETRLLKARRAMGEDLKDVPDEILDVHLTEFNFLLDSWLDEYERKTFDNMTLRQLLREG